MFPDSDDDEDNHNDGSRILKDLDNSGDMQHIMDSHLSSSNANGGRERNETLMFGAPNEELDIH